MNSLVQFRMVALAEGVSFLVLLFVAMPLKYLAGWPSAVRIVGSLHGALFVLFIATLARAAAQHDWSLLRTLYAFVASLIPFGTFVFDRSLKHEIATRATH
jgi:integral membrane protein